MDNQDIFMQRALHLAQLGGGNVAPNPMVGCVIVFENQIVGEGYHEQYGQAHAEVNAVKNAEKKYPNPQLLASILQQSTFFVTLEPCAHYGKTPPCAMLLAKIKPKKVIICNTDTNPLVAGKGIAILQNAGIAVEIYPKNNPLAKKGRALNKRFFTFMEKKRPYIVLKWAESKDGFITKFDENNHPISTPISGQLAQYVTHKWRTEQQGIMIGTNTALIDNPKLNARLWEGNNPVRIVIDKSLKIPSDYHIFDKKQKTLVFNELKNEETENLCFIKIEKNNQFQNTQTSLLPEILSHLYHQKIQSVLVEGGSFLLEDFISQNIWDEMRVWKANKILENGIKSPKIPIILSEILKIEDDVLLMGKNFFV